MARWQWPHRTTRYFNANADEPGYDERGKIPLRPPPYPDAHGAKPGYDTMRTTVHLAVSPQSLSGGMTFCALGPSNAARIVSADLTRMSSHASGVKNAECGVMIS